MPQTANRARLHVLAARTVQHAAEGDHSDGGGLILRIRESSAHWVFRYTSPNGRRREMGLGVVHRGSVKQAGEALDGARQLAHAQRDLLREGRDPIDERDAKRGDLRKQEAAKRAQREREHWTLARAARDYHERVIERTRSVKHSAQWIASLENHVPSAIWNKPLGEIEPPELLQALLAVKPHERARNIKDSHPQETVRRMRQRLDAIYEDAIFHKRCTTNPAAAIRRKMGEASPRKRAGAFAALAYRDAPRFMSRLRAMDGTAARCLEFAMLTTARTNEALSAEWSEFELDAGVWIIPAAKMKAGEDHVVYLSSCAVKLLKVQREQTGGRLVFPSPQPGKEQQRPLSNMAMLAVLDRLNSRDKTTVHGLCRSTFSTWANETGKGRPDVIEACLAHKESDKVRRAYNRAKFNDERRELLQAWAEYLNSPTAEVVLLRAA